MYKEENLLPLSALSHLLFCRRRAALLFLEGQWEENVATVQGDILHKKAHGNETESRGALKILRGLRLCSMKLGLSGVADVVEFRYQETGDSGAKDEASRYEVFPVEYKRGKKRAEEGFEVQLCAQALCLEEMLGCTVSKGAIYYGKSARRNEVLFSQALREKTKDAAKELHELIAKAHTPPAEYGNKCHFCSMLPVCLPVVTQKKGKVATYLKQAFGSLEKEEGG